MNYDEFARFALTLSGVNERAGRYEIDLLRDDHHMARLREKGTVIAIRLPWETIEILKKQDPVKFRTGGHYEGYPYVQIFLEDLEPEEAKNLTLAAHQAAPNNF